LDPATTSNDKEAVPFFAVSSMEASIRYYLDGLGIQMTKKWGDAGKLRWCWLQHGGAALMLQEFRSGRICDDSREITTHWQAS
jgi:lactoylglutathione lyase